MSGIVKLRETLHYRILLARSIEYLVSGLMFERLWEASDKDQQAKAQKYIDKFDKPGIQQWMQAHPSLDVEELSVRQLYPIAQRLNILNYSRLPKECLVAAIKKAESDGS